MKKARLKKSTRKMRMVSRSWQNCLEGPQNCPQGWGFVYFFLPWGCNFTKIFCPGAGILTTLKKFPEDQPGGGVCWCLELTDALAKYDLTAQISKHIAEPTNLTTKYVWAGTSISYVPYDPTAKISKHVADSTNLTTKYVWTGTCISQVQSNSTDY